MVGLTSGQSIVHYWFGRIKSDGDYPLAKSQELWFRKDLAVDGEIRDAFEETLTRAKAGAFANWKESVQGALGLMILLDQFPRYIYRGEVGAFACDEKALMLAKWGVSRGVYKSLYPVERAFFFMPYIHAEDLESQKESLRLYEALELSSPASIRMKMNQFRNMAIKAHDTIERFGRFPQRNIILGRESTLEEKRFLELKY